MLLFRVGDAVSFTMQTTALLKSASKQRNLKDLLSLRLLWKITSQNWCEKLRIWDTTGAPWRLDIMLINKNKRICYQVDFTFRNSRLTLEMILKKKQKIRGRIKTIQTTALLKSSRILRRVFRVAPSVLEKETRKTGDQRKNRDFPGVLCISQNSSITQASPSDCLVSYPGH